MYRKYKKKKKWNGYLGSIGMQFPYITHSQFIKSFPTITRTTRYLHISAFQFVSTYVLCLTWLCNVNSHIVWWLMSLKTITQWLDVEYDAKRALLLALVANRLLWVFLSVVRWVDCIRFTTTTARCRYDAINHDFD